MDIRHISWSDSWKWLLAILVELVLLLAVFAVGMQVGFHKTRSLFMYGQPGVGGMHRGWGSAEPFGMMPGHIPAQEHGIVGTVVKFSGNEMTVKNIQGTEEIITVDSATVIRNSFGTATTTDIHSGDQVVAFGQPGTAGTLVAKLIRVVTNAVPALQPN